jgi:hypothetical protein
MDEADIAAKGNISHAKEMGSTECRESVTGVVSYSRSYPQQKRSKLDKVSIFGIPCWSNPLFHISTNSKRSN